MSPRVSSFVAGLLVGIAVTAGVAAIVIRLSGVEMNASGGGSGGSSGGHARGTTQNGVRELRLAHGLHTKHPVHAGIVRFAELVEEESGGKITIQIFPNAELGSETETVEQLQAGTLDFAKASAAPLESFAPEYGVFSIPYAFRDRDHNWAVLDGAIGREILDAASDRGLRGLCYFDAGARSFYTPSKPILNPSDVAGLKVRVMQSPTAMNMIKAYGGSPTPMAYGELYSALQSGLVDAAENNPPSFYSSRHYEVCKEFTLNEHARIPDVLLVSERTWESLSDEAHGWLLDAAGQASVYQRELWEQNTRESLAEIEKLGVEINRVDQRPFADATKELRDSYSGTSLGDLLERIQAVRPDAEAAVTDAGVTHADVTRAEH